MKKPSKFTDPFCRSRSRTMLTTVIGILRTKNYGHKKLPAFAQGYFSAHLVNNSLQFK